MIFRERAGFTSAGTRRLIAAALLALVVGAVAAGQVTRPGYSPDEEFTVFAARGIAAHGLPLLPSGLLYDRGLAYSYAAAGASAVGLDEIAGARAVSLSAALVALLVLWHGVRHAAGERAAWFAVVLVACSLPFWVAATSARFYSPFLACYLAALVLLARLDPADPPHLRHWRLAFLVAVAALARLSHELAFTLAAVPVAALLLAGRARARSWLFALLAIVLGLVAAQGLIVALHFLAPASGATMIRRFFIWQVVNLLARPPVAAPLGALLVGGLVWLLVRGVAPWTDATPAGRRLLAAVAGMVLVWAAASPSAGSLEYPLDMLGHLGWTQPVLVVALLGLMGARAAGLGGPWRPLARAAHLLWLGWIVFFGVIESGITIHYVLLPATFMLAAVGVDLAAVARHQAQRDPRAGPRAGGAAIAILVAVAIVPWLPRPAGTLDAVRPTLVPPPALREWASQAPLVACTDELACLLLAGRVDRWLALDDFLRKRFVVTRNGRDVGVYAGAPAVYRLSSLFDGPAPPDRVLVIDVSRPLPVGPSAAFLDRALAGEPVRAGHLVKTPQLRVLELDVP